MGEHQAGEEDDHGEVRAGQHQLRQGRKPDAAHREGVLEGIFHEIGVSPLRTEPDDLSGVITNEMWMEKQLQLRKSPEKGFKDHAICGTVYASAGLEFMSSMFWPDICETKRGPLVYAAAKGFISPHATAHALNPLALSVAIVGHSWLF